MSMPIIKPNKVTRCDAITDIVESVALEQTGLSHIINAEGEKIQAAVANFTTIDELLKVNDSVKSMVNSITRLEVILQGKLELFNNCLCEKCECVNSVTNLIVNNEEAGKLIKIGENLYTYEDNGLSNEIIFEVNPKVEVTPIGELPKGITFDNYTLIIPEKFDFSTPYQMKFMVGTGACQYEIVINTIVNA